MMDFPLLLRTILYRAALVYPDQEVVSREGTGVVRETYRELDNRCRKLARALDGLGLAAGDHVSSFGWNTHRHLELYFGVPCSGRVLHTVNIRLASEQLVYTINHAQDRVLFVDPDLAAGIAKLASQLETVQAYVVLGDGEAAQAAARLLPNALLYEDLLAAQGDGYAFPDLDERSDAILAYTSATTGNPKGVMYSHRGLYLHCMSCLTVELAPSDEDVTMPIVPMFHVNAWGYPFLSTWVGARQVMPGAHPTPADLCQLITEQGVTISAGVPTVWMA
ncbi:MAG: AMP-binding protein, partial [Firmicutes bacterium]|nr:AMP-binding protein [Bacillota bacterium]